MAWQKATQMIHRLAWAVMMAAPVSLIAPVAALAQGRSAAVPADPWPRVVDLSNGQVSGRRLPPMTADEEPRL
jgi:hypothetical protein